MGNAFALILGRNHLYLTSGSMSSPCSEALKHLIIVLLSSPTISPANNCILYLTHDLFITFFSPGSAAWIGAGGCCEYNTTRRTELRTGVWTKAEAVLGLGIPVSFPRNLSLVALSSEENEMNKSDDENNYCSRTLQT